MDLNTTDSYKRSKDSNPNSTPLTLLSSIQDCGKLQKGSLDRTSLDLYKDFRNSVDRLDTISNHLHYTHLIHRDHDTLAGHGRGLNIEA